MARNVVASDNVISIANFRQANLWALEYTDENLLRALTSHGGALDVYLANLIAGARGQGAVDGTDFLANREIGDTTIYNGKAVVYGFRITTTLSAHTWRLRSGATDKVVIPASSVAANAPQKFPMGVYCNPCVVNQGAGSSAGVVEWYWAKLPADFPGIG